MRKNLADQRRLGQWLRAQRLRKGWSLQRLATRAEVSRKHLGEVERGIVDVSYTALNRITDALSVKIPQLHQLRRSTNADGDIVAAEEVPHLRQTMRTLERLIRLRSR